MEDRKKIKGQSTNKARREAAPAPLQEWGGVSSGKKKKKKKDQQWPRKS